MNAPKVSIIIPSYNTAPGYLEECLVSCFRQGLTEDEFEIILIDDGSISPPREVYSQWEKAHGNILVFRQENSGQSVARNVGITHAKGKYCCFVDADDFLLDNTLAVALAAAESDALDVAYYSGFGGGNVAGTECVRDGKDFLISCGFRSGIWCFLLNTAFLKKSGIRFLPGILCEDGIFAYEIVSVARRVKRVLGGGVSLSVERRQYAANP